MGKILQRCDICKKFHAAYAVPETATVTRHYCYTCWMEKFGNQIPSDVQVQPPSAPEDEERPIPNDQTHRT